MHARDTSPEVATTQHEGYRRMGPSGRFRAAAELTNFVREAARAGIRMRHPEYSEDQVTRELARIVYQLSADRREDCRLPSANLRGFRAS
jgi:hypothetical protein